MIIKYITPLPFKEYQPYVDKIVSDIQYIIPEKINGIEIDAAIDFRKPYLQFNPDAQVPDLEMGVYFHAHGILTENPYAEQVGYPSVSNSISFNEHLYQPKTDDLRYTERVYELMLKDCLVKLIRFAKTGKFDDDRRIETNE